MVPAARFDRLFIRHLILAGCRSWIVRDPWLPEGRGDRSPLSPGYQKGVDVRETPWKWVWDCGWSPVNDPWRVSHRWMELSSWYARAKNRTGVAGEIMVKWNTGERNAPRVPVVSCTRARDWPLEIRLRYQRMHFSVVSRRYVVRVSLEETREFSNAPSLVWFSPFPLNSTERLV